MTTNSSGYDYGIAGQVLTSNGDNVYPSFQDAPGGFNPNLGNYNFEDYDRANITSVFTAAGRYNTGYDYLAPTDNGHPGMISIRATQAKTGSNKELWYIGTGLLPGAPSSSSSIWPRSYFASTQGDLTIECDMYFVTASNATLRYQWYFGLSQFADLTLSNRHLVVTYQDNVNSGKFVFLSKGPGGVTTTVNTTVTVALNTWYNISIITNSTNADLYINGVLQGNITTNLPTDQSMSAGISWCGVSGVGYGSPQSMYVLDYLYTQQNLNTPR